MKLISIIIPTYNRAHLLGETLESIRQQTYTNWECIVIDDGSTDGTEAMMKKLITDDARIQYYKKPNTLPKGPSSARNFGFGKSKGDYINWFDSDDRMHPEKLETDIEYIQSGTYDFTISQSEFFSEIGTPSKKYWNENLWSEDPINNFIVKNIGWGVNAALWKKYSLEAVALKFDETLMTADDFLYHIQALECNLKPVIIDKTLSFLREHPERLNDFKIKSPFKLSVNVYVMERKKTLQLNKTTITYLNNQFKQQFSNLLKNKQVDVAKTYYNKGVLKMYSKTIRKDIKRMYTRSMLIALPVLDTVL